MRLVIAEKPSVAASIAKVVGANNRKKSHYEGGGYRVSWCLGHLVELAAPDAYNADYSDWQMKDLPILPEQWKYSVIPKTQPQFNALTGLMLQSDVDTIVCATDAGREGELIFRLVYMMCGCKKPVKRLWVSSMEEKALADGMAHLKDSAEYDRLYAAALCRSRADWIVGLNASRLYSLLYDANLSIGRVLSPTLALLVHREDDIAAFKKEPFYTLDLDCGKFSASSDRIRAESAAKKLWSRCDGEQVTVKAVECKEKTDNPPKLYDLTSLQRDANRLFGYSAKDTLVAAQNLYEAKLLTYPRTDSRYLTDDMRDGLPALVKETAARLTFADGISDAVNFDRVINSKKVSDHHALLPTQTALKADLSSTPTMERNILTLVAVRLLCAVDGAHRYTETTVTLSCADALFSAKGRTELAAGWKEIEQAYFKTLRDRPKEDKVTTLPAMAEGDTFKVIKAEIRTGSTTPPKHFTEDTLLAAMENASAEEFAEIQDLERKGLGTPATRAEIIEKMLRVPKKGNHQSLAIRDGRNLLPTEKGVQLIRALPEQLTSASTTAEWEDGLTKIARGELDANAWMGGITDFVRQLVASPSVLPENPFQCEKTRQEPVGKCPWCGRPVYENPKGFCCSGHNEEASPCQFALWIDNHFFATSKKTLSRSVVSRLLRDGRVPMKGLYSARTGKTYDATVVLTEKLGKDNRRWPQFELEFATKKKK